MVHVLRPEEESDVGHVRRRGDCVIGSGVVGHVLPPHGMEPNLIRHRRFRAQLSIIDVKDRRRARYCVTSWRLTVGRYENGDRMIDGESSLLRSASL
jgi:hypothetical protein